MGTHPPTKPQATNGGNVEHRGRIHKTAERARRSLAGLVDPAELFRSGKHEGKYGDLDERGVPLTNADGSELNEKQKKSLTKEFEAWERPDMGGSIFFFWSWCPFSVGLIAGKPKRKNRQFGEAPKKNRRPQCPICRLPALASSSVPFGGMPLDRLGHLSRRLFKATKKKWDAHQAALAKYTRDLALFEKQQEGGAGFPYSVRLPVQSWKQTGMFSKRKILFQHPPVQRPAVSRVFLKGVLQMRKLALAGGCLRGPKWGVSNLNLVGPEKAFRLIWQHHIKGRPWLWQGKSQKKVV